MIGGNRHANVILVQRGRGVGHNRIQRFVIVARADARKCLSDPLGDGAEFGIQRLNTFVPRQRRKMGKAIAQRLIEQVYNGR